MARTVTEGRRREFAAFGWRSEDVPDPQGRETFERSKLNWREPDKEPHNDLVTWHRQLIQLRREIPALSDSRVEQIRTSFDESAKWFVVSRGRLVVACNLSNIGQRVPVSLGHGAAFLLASASNIQFAHDTVALPPDSVAIMDSEPDRDGMSMSNGQ